MKCSGFFLAAILSMMMTQILEAYEGDSQRTFSVTGVSHSAAFPEFDALAIEAATDLQRNALRVCGDAVEVGPRTTHDFRRHVQIDSLFSCGSRNSKDESTLAQNAHVVPASTQTIHCKALSSKYSINAYVTTQPDSQLGGFRVSGTALALSASYRATSPLGCALLPSYDPAIGNTRYIECNGYRLGNWPVGDATGLYTFRYFALDIERDVHGDMQATFAETFVNDYLEGDSQVLTPYPGELLRPDGQALGTCSLQ
jgi:hypothetical protein